MLVMCVDLCAYYLFSFPAQIDINQLTRSPSLSLSLFFLLSSSYTSYHHHHHHHHHHHYFYYCCCCCCLKYCPSSIHLLLLLLIPPLLLLFSIRFQLDQSINQSINQSLLQLSLLCFFFPPPSSSPFPLSKIPPLFCKSVFYFKISNRSSVLLYSPPPSPPF